MSGLERGPKTQAMAKDNNTEKGPCAKIVRRAMHRCRLPALVTWSRRAAAAEAITHCVAHPTRGPLSGFFRGGCQ